MIKQIDDIPLSTRNRLHYLEFKLFWEGRVNRGDLTDKFKISIPQASGDISRYQEFAPQNIMYNASLKYYFPTESFSPLFIKINSNEYFSEAVTSDDNIFGFVPTPTRIIDEDNLKRIVQAIRFKHKLAIDYRSFKNPQADNIRWVSPHAFGFDGFRWHVRAYCHKDNKFKDYVLGRIAKIVDSSECKIDYKSDSKWFEYVDVIIGPNPELSDDQKILLEMDYGMVNHQISIKCRKAMLLYFLKKLGIDTEAKKERPGEEQQIVLVNKNEIISLMDN